jgi:hypothetical protein
MNEKTKLITDHKEVMTWAEQHNAKPALMEDKSAERKHGIRFDFPGSGDEELLSEETSSRIVSWEDFFEVFDRENLALILYGENHKDLSWAYRFVKRDETGNDQESVQDIVEEFKEALEVSEKVVVDEDVSHLDPALIGETGNDTLTQNPTPEIMGEQSMLGDMSDPSSDDDVTVVAEEMGLLLKEDKKRLDES